MKIGNRKKELQNISVDIAVFGYGEITKQIIENFHNFNYRILCITDNPNISKIAKAGNNLEFLTYKNIKQCHLVCNWTIFSWRDSGHLILNDLELHKWIESDLFMTNRSLFLSSASVYRSSLVALNESCNNLDLNVKTNKKFILEKMLSELMQNKNIKHTNLRISNVYGRDLNYGLIGNLIDSIKFEKNVNIFQNLNIIRDYIHVDVIVYAVQHLLELETSKDRLNISTGIGTSISEVLEIFAKSGYKFENKSNSLDSSSIKIGSILDCSAIRLIIKWNPRNLENQIKKLLDKVSG